MKPLCRITFASAVLLIVTCRPAYSQVLYAPVYQTPTYYVGGTQFQAAPSYSAYSSYSSSTGIAAAPAYYYQPFAASAPSVSYYGSAAYGVSAVQAPVLMSPVAAPVLMAPTVGYVPAYGRYTVRYRFR